MSGEFYKKMLNLLWGEVSKCEDQTYPAIGADLLMVSLSIFISTLRSLKDKHEREKLIIGYLENIEMGLKDLEESEKK